MGSAGKEFACSVGYLGLIPGLGRSPGEDPTPVFWPGEFHGVTKSQTQLSDRTELNIIFHILFHYDLSQQIGYIPLCYTVRAFLYPF